MDNNRFDNTIRKMSKILANEQLDTVLDYYNKYNISITYENGEYKSLSTIIDEIIQQCSDFLMG